MIQLCFFLACYDCGYAIIPGDETECGVCRTGEEVALGIEIDAKVDVCPKCIAKKEG